MSWRIVTVKSKSKLDYKMDYLVVRSEERTSRIHLSEISVLMIESTAVSLTAYLLSELSKRKIKVIFCDEKGNPSAEVFNLYGSHDTSRKIRDQIQWNGETKKLVWAEIVRSKIQGQLSNLPESHVEARALLHTYITEIQPGDPTNREAHAAKVYFNALFGMDFSRSDDHIINAALNYGYGILLSAFNREIVSCGYLTTLGIFHDNMFNHFNLSCDFMEPFRPFVDRMVSTLRFTKFDHEEKLQMVDILNQNVRIHEQNHFMNNAIRIYTLSVLEALNTNDVSLIRKPAYE